MTHNVSTPASSKKGRKAHRTPDGQMSLWGHLRELRNRSIIALVALALGAVVGFIVYRPTFTILTEPVSRLSTEEHPAEVMFSSVAQPFDIMLQVALFVGVVLSSPMWLYQLWAFIVPGLKKVEKRYALAFIAVSVPLFVGGVLLGWWALPQALQFFIGLAPEGTANRILVNVYVPFVLRLMLAFGVALILPVILVGLNLMGVLKGKQIVEHWRISVFIIALIAAIAAPGSDLMTMFYLAAPLVALFGLAIGFCLISDRRRLKKAAKQESVTEEELQHGPKSLDQL